MAQLVRAFDLDVMISRFESLSRFEKIGKKRYDVEEEKTFKGIYTYIFLYIVHIFI